MLVFSFLSPSQHSPVLSLEQSLPLSFLQTRRSESFSRAWETPPSRAGEAAAIVSSQAELRVNTGSDFPSFFLPLACVFLS